MFNVKEYQKIYCNLSKGNKTVEEFKKERK